MKQEYCIISIDETRKVKKDYIRAGLSWNEAEVTFVNGKNPEELAFAAAYWKNIQTPGPFKAGEFGIFYSVLNCLEYGAANDGILYFEDDAQPVIDFQVRVEAYLAALPKNADLLALWSPLNQHYDYTEAITYNSLGEPIYDRHQGSIFDFGHPELARLWQGYGNVAMYFSKNGCKKLLGHIAKEGFYSPIDCLICIATHRGYLNGYSLKPGVLELINYDWNAPTTIHHSKWGMLDELIKENNGE